MDLWLATANPKLAETHLSRGIFRGVITNPYVVALEERNKVDVFTDLCSICDAAYYQLQDNDTSSMLEEADLMLYIDPEKMRIKVPATNNGLAVIRRLTEKGVEVMATVVPTIPRMILAIAAGAKVIAPYGSMLQKRGIRSKMDEVVTMQSIIDRQCYEVDICTGIYDVTELTFYAGHGVRSGFIWPKDVEPFLDQPLVEEGSAAFDEYWATINQSRS
jgi:transaldolase